MPQTKLTPKQERFAHEYVVDCNATQAANRAGYSKRTAYRTGADNLKKPQIKELIDSLQAERTRQSGLNADQVLEELANIALFDVGECYNDDGSLKPIKDLPETVRRNIASIESIDVHTGSKAVGVTHKIKFHSKSQALTNLAKHFKLLTEKHEHSGKDGRAIEVNTGPDLSKLSDKDLAAMEVLLAKAGEQ